MISLKRYPILLTKIVISKNTVNKYVRSLRVTLSLFQRTCNHLRMLFASMLVVTHLKLASQYP